MPELGDHIGSGLMNVFDDGFEGSGNAVLIALNHERQDAAGRMNRLAIGEDEADSAPRLGPMTAERIGSDLIVEADVCSPA